MNIDLTARELAYLEMLAHGRNDPKIGVVANRRIDERTDDYQMNLNGLKAEYVVAKYLGVELDDEINLAGRRRRGNLRYFDRWLEVKWNNRSTGDLYFDNLLQFGADVAVLVVPGPRGAVRIVGWITRDEFKAKWIMRDWGYGNRLCVGQMDLKPIENLKQESQLKLAI